MLHHGRMTDAELPRAAARALAGAAIAYGVLHHVGSGLQWLGTVGPTCWADWIDILTPYAVILPVAVALWHCSTRWPAWLVLAPARSPMPRATVSTSQPTRSPLSR